MSVVRLKRISVAAVIVCGLLVVLFRPLGPQRFDVRWRRVHVGMTEEEVRQSLGTPAEIGTSGCQGVGGRPVIRWEYKGWIYTHYVDFDYTGPGGAPAAFRIERRKERIWPVLWR